MLLTYNIHIDSQHSIVILFCCVIVELLISSHKLRLCIGVFI